MAKVIQIYPLMNYSSGYEEYRLMSVSSKIYEKSVDEGGSKQMKELLEERLDDLFNNDIESYFDVDVTEELENCINELAKGNDANIQGERFWWGDVEDVVI